MEEKKHGGKREGAGAPRKAEVEQSNVIFLTAIREAKNVDNDFDARKAFAVDLLSFERGKMFIAEHLFGKPKEIIDNNVYINSFDIKEVLKFDNLKP